jgi:hypothetical protein
MTATFVDAPVADLAPVAAILALTEQEQEYASR